MGRSLGVVRIVSLALLIGLTGFSGWAAAQDEAAGLPGDVLGTARQQMTIPREASGRDPLETATERTHYANDVIAQVKAELASGNAARATALLGEYEAEIDQASIDLREAQAQGRDVSEAIAAVERSTTQHTEVLTGLLEQVPEEAKPAIRQAIEVSRRGRNTALDTLETIQRGERPGAQGLGRPEGVGPPAGVGRPGNIGGPPAGIGDRPGGIGGPPTGIGRPAGIGGGPGGGRGPDGGFRGGGPPGGRGRGGD